MSFVSKLPAQTLSCVTGTYTTLDTDPQTVTSGVVFAFTERGGGVSEAPYDSLNLGTHVGDKPEAVAENRRRVLADLGMGKHEENLLVPNQVHGTHVTVVTQAQLYETPDGTRVAQEIYDELKAGADAIVCTAPGVPVMLCYADCVPVVLVCKEGFAVVHSGWKGTIGHIAPLAAKVLSEATHTDLAKINAYIGPHIDGEHYEVSLDLLADFIYEFDPSVNPSAANLDLARAITLDLVGAGLDPKRVVNSGFSTITDNDRFFSHRLSGGTTGRHAAIACIAQGVTPAFKSC